MLPQLMLDTVHMLLPPTPDTPDMLVMLDSDTPVMLDSDTPVLLDSDTDMLDIMASVRLKPKLMLMLTPLVRSMLDSPSITPTLDMLVLDMLVMLDILAMLVWDTLVLAILD